MEQTCAFSRLVLPMILCSCGNPYDFNAYEEYRFELGASAFIAEGLEDVCVLPGGEYLYITCPDNDLVYVVDTEDLEVVHCISVTDPRCVCALPSGDLVYVSSSSTNSIALIDPEYFSYVLTIGVGESPVGVCALPGNDFVYVANSGDSSITVINAVNQQVCATIPCDPHPFGICCDPEGEYVFCTVSDPTATGLWDSRLQIVRTSDNTVVMQTAVGQDCRGISCWDYGNLAGEDTRFLAIADNGQNKMQMLVYDPPEFTWFHYMDLPEPLDACVHPSGWCAFGTGSGSNEIAAYYDFPIVEEFITVGQTPTGICSDESGNRLYVVHDSGEVVVLDRQ